MATPLTINGVTFQYPQQGDKNWGPTLTNWSSAVTTGMLQKAGGSFPLTAEVDFGGSFGMKVLSIKTQETNIATTGILRMANASTGLVWRNAANSANLALTVNSSNQLTFNGTNIGATTSLTNAHILVGNVSNQPADVALSGDATITNAGVLTIGAGAVGLSKIANGTANQLIGANAGGSANEFKSLSGTANQVTVTNGTGTITLSGPQDIATTSSPTFGGLTLSKSTAATPQVSINKTDSGVANQSGGSITFNNSGPAATARSTGVVAGTLGFNFSQPTSGALQAGATILAEADGTQNGVFTPTALVFSTGSTGALATALRLDSSQNATLHGALAMSSNKITGMAQGTVSGDAIAFPVGTGQISANAVTNIQNTGSGTSSDSTTIASQAITTTGGKVLIVASATLAGISGTVLSKANATVVMKVTRGGTSITGATQTFSLIMNNSANTFSVQAPISITAVDSPTAGTYTYTLSYDTGGFGSPSVISYALSVLEFKV